VATQASPASKSSDIASSTRPQPKHPTTTQTKFHPSSTRASTAANQRQFPLTTDQAAAHQEVTFLATSALSTRCKPGSNEGGSCFTSSSTGTSSSCNARQGPGKDPASPSNTADQVNITQKTVTWVPRISTIVSSSQTAWPEAAESELVLAHKAAPRLPQHGRCSSASCFPGSQSLSRPEHNAADESGVPLGPACTHASLLCPQGELGGRRCTTADSRGTAGTGTTHQSHPHHTGGMPHRSATHHQQQEHTWGSGSSSRTSSAGSAAGALNSSSSRSKSSVQVDPEVAAWAARYSAEKCILGPPSCKRFSWGGSMHLRHRGLVEMPPRTSTSSTRSRHQSSQGVRGLPGVQPDVTLGRDLEGVTANTSSGTVTSNGTVAGAGCTGTASGAQSSDRLAQRPLNSSCYRTLEDVTSGARSLSGARVTSAPTARPTAPMTARYGHGSGGGAVGGSETPYSDALLQGKLAHRMARATAGQSRTGGRGGTNADQSSSLDDDVDQEMYTVQERPLRTSNYQTVRL
jgi:hypothetical protein